MTHPPTRPSSPSHTPELMRRSASMSSRMGRHSEIFIFFVCVLFPIILSIFSRKSPSWIPPFPSYTHTHTHTRTHTHTCMCMHMFVCMYISVCVCVCVCIIYIAAYVCMYAHTYVCVCVCVCVHDIYHSLTVQPTNVLYIYIYLSLLDTYYPDVSRRPLY